MQQVINTLMNEKLDADKMSLNPPLQPSKKECECRCHLPLVTTHLCPDCFNGCPPFQPSKEEKSYLLGVDIGDKKGDKTIKAYGYEEKNKIIITRMEEVEPSEEEFRDNMPLKEQVDILADFLMKHYPNRIINGGAIETAIQILTPEPSKEEPESKCKKGFYDMDCYECKDMVECLDKPESKEEFTDNEFRNEMRDIEKRRVAMRKRYIKDELESKEECKCELDGFQGAITSQNCKIHNPNLKSKEEWEKEFDKKFDIGFDNQGIIFEDEIGIHRAIPLLVVKKFIRSEKKKSEKETFERIEKDVMINVEQIRQEALDKRNKEIQKIIEDMPTKFPERESDEYDKAYKDAKEYLLINLSH